MRRFADRLAQALDHQAARLVERASIDRRGRLGVAAAAEHGRERRGVELRGPAARYSEDPAVHLDEHGEARGVGHIDQLVRQIRDPLDVLRRCRRGDEHLDARHLVRLERVEQGRQELALGLAERGMEEAREQLLLGAVA